jgi:membrane protease YdiL (CAAX protease family)
MTAGRDSPGEHEPPLLVSSATLAAALALCLALNVLVVFVLFPAGALDVLARPTGGLISSTLFANALLLAGVVGFLRWRGGLRAGDLGLARSGFVPALVAMILVWLGVNLLEAAWALLVHAPFQVDPGWSRLGVSHRLGAFLGQLLGNALFEEILFRAVLFQQIRLRLLRSGRRPATALLLGLTISQAIFALIHVPLRLRTGMALAELPGELALLFALGVLLALLYRWTGNLYLVVGVHALSNAPVLAIQPAADWSSNGAIAAVASLVLLALWPRTREA